MSKTDANSAKSDLTQILLVEDEEHLAVGIRFNLEAEGFHVTAVGDGHAAMDYMREQRGQVALVILDLMLPGMSGYEVCESLRENDHLMPVLILSARSHPEDRAKGFDVGADQYLTKPFELDELISRINNLLARSQRRQGTGATDRVQPTFEFAGVKVDFANLQIQVGGEEVKMTRLEMKLLEYFVKNEGRVVPRGELLTNVWEMPASITTRAPDQFIRRLRKIIEPDPSSPQHLLTIREAGYKFVAEPDA